jgi:hypothetical protein
MHKYLILLAIFFGLFTACKSPLKLVEEGNYDKAIERSIKKIFKGNANAEDKKMLDRAYNLANENELNRVKLLKLEGNPENWENIYLLYTSLDRRQREIKKVLPFQIKGKTYNYPQIDYSLSIVEAKTKAADYFYTYAQQLMNIGTKEGYRQAYYQLNKAKQYKASAFPNINHQIADAKFLGTSRVLVDIANATNQQFPSDYYEQLLSFNTSSYSSTWVDYNFGRTNRTTNYDYLITIVLENIYMSPEQYRRTEIQRKKEVPDGFEYLLNKKGNVKKDSLGNDIKITNYKTLSCKLIQRQQFKEVSIQAQVEYFQVNPENFLFRRQIAATSTFEHNSAMAIGDLKALLPEDVVLLNYDPAPFPDDLSMLYDCIDPLQKSIEAILQENKKLIQ